MMISKKGTPVNVGIETTGEKQALKSSYASKHLSRPHLISFQHQP